METNGDISKKIIDLAELDFQFGDNVDLAPKNPVETQMQKAVAKLLVWNDPTLEN